MQNAPDDININLDRAPGTAVVSLEGDVDMSRSPDLRQALKSTLTGDHTRLIIDLSSVHYMDSSGLATLVEAMRQAKACKTELVLACLNEKVQAIFEIARLDQFFIIAPSVDHVIDG